jgi:hypothetical protein
MGFMIRQIADDAKLTDEIALEAIASAVPEEVVRAVVSDLGAAEERDRKLPTHVTLMLGIGMNLYPSESLERVYRKMVKGLRFIWPDPEIELVTKGAISQARYRVGAAPMVELFRRVCQPLATADTRGAFLFGLRLMAVDGTCEDLPDTPENVRVFGRPNGGRGEGAFPQVQAVYLCECGTHAIVDAGFWPIATSERVGGLRVLRSVKAGMLVMWDRGFHSFDMAKKTRAQHADFLGRVPSHVKLKVRQRLPDGSYLAYLYPSDPKRKKRGEHLLVRVIEYTVDDETRVGHGERHRLITSLLDHKQFPALDLACAYHERWEVEITIDEIDTHQRLVSTPLRSQKPVGVLQELYGLLVAHYAVRSVMHAAALEADVDPDRLSFTNALSLICDAISEFQMVDPLQRTTLFQRLLRDIARHLLPERDNRCNPRVVKRKMSNFPRKRPEHRRPMQPSKPFRDVVVMLI